VASKYGGRVQLGRQLIEDTGSGLESPDALIDDTVLGELVKERLRYAQEFGDNPDLPNNMLDTQLKNIYLGKGILERIAPIEHINIPEDPEVDRIVDEAHLSPGSVFSGGQRKKKPPATDALAKKIADTERAEKKAAAKKKREAKIRDTVVNMLLRQGNELTDAQKALVKDGSDKPMEALTDIVKWDKRVDREIGKDQLQRDKPFRNKDALARKVIAYADDPEGFERTWYKDNPVFAKRRLPDGKIEKKEIIFDEDNPDPDLEGVDLVKYANAMNKKFTKPGENSFIEYDYGPPTKTGDTMHPADLLSAAATGKEFTEPEKLEFPEISESDIEPTRNRLGMVRRMLFGELSDEELAYLMELIDQDQQFSSGGFVDNKAFKYLQRQYGPNHPVLSDKRFKKQYVGKLASTIRRIV
jgi:hypothetical protein